MSFHSVCVMSGVPSVCGRMSFHSICVCVWGSLRNTRHTHTDRMKWHTATNHTSL